MSARTVSVTLNATVGGFVGAMGKAASAVDQLTSKMGESARGIAQSAATNSQAWNTVGSTMTRVGAVAAAGLGVAAKAAVDWESAFAGVRKTVDQSSPAFATLENDLRGMAREMATSHTEIAAVAEAAGALGVATEDVVGFTRTMVMLGETTNLSAGEAADSIAQFTNIMGTAPDLVDNLGSALVALGNNGASTERQIVQMGQRIAAAGSQVGLSEAQVLGFASAVASTGVEVEAGGTAVSNGFAKMSKAVREGGQELELMAKTAGMSAAEFKTAFETDAAGAITSFVEGLGRAHEAGQNMDDILGALGITGIREADTFKRLALSGNLLRDSLTTANDAFRDGSALMDEYGERAKTTESKMRVAWNQIKDAAISTGQVMLPVLGQLAQGVGGMANAFGQLPQPVQAAGAALTGVVAAAGLGAGAFMRAVPAIVEFRAASATLAKDMPKTAAAMSGLGKAAGGLLALTAVVGVLGAIDASMRDTVVNAESLGNAFTAMNQTVGQSGGGIEKLNTQFQNLHKNVGFIGVGETLNGIGDAMQRVSNPAFGAGIDRFFHELGVGTSTTIEAENAFAALDAQLVQMNPAQAAQGFAQITAEAERFGISAEQLVAMFPQYAAQIQGWANANKFAFQDGAAGAQELINMMGGQLPPALAAAGHAAGLTAGEIDGMTRTLAAVPPNTTVAVSGEGILPTTTTVEGLRDAIKDVPDDKFVRVTMPDGRVVEGLAKDVRAAIDAIGEEKNIRVATPGMADVLIGMTTLKTTLEDVPAQKLVSVSIDGAEAVETRMHEVGRLVKDVPDDKTVTINIPGIGNLTLQAGQLKTAVNEIDDKRVTLTVDAAGAITGSASAKAAIDTVTGKQVGIEVDAATATAQAQELQNKLEGIKDKTVNVTGAGLPKTVQDLEGIARAIDGVPPDKQVTIRLMNGESFTATAGELQAALDALKDKNVNVSADPAGAIAGAATAQGAVNAVTDKNVSLFVDPSGAITGSAQAKASVDTVTGKTVPLGADASGAVAGAGQAQGAIGAVNGKTVSLIVDPSGAISGSARASASVNTVTGKTVDVNANPAGAVSGANTAKSAVGSVPNVDRNINVSTNASATASAARSAMNAVQDVVRWITVKLRNESADGGLMVAGMAAAHAGPEHVGAQRFITGGRVAGWSPHPRADNIPAWLTAGEIVQSNEAGDRYGRGRLLALNAGLVDPAEFAAFMRAQGFAGGGQARDAFSRPATVSLASTSGMTPPMAAASKTVNQEFHYHYPIGERESTATRRAASAAATGASF